MKVLYLGMASDVLTPLCLAPDVDTLYVIDLLDTAASLSELYERIKIKVRDGSDYAECVEAYDFEADPASEDLFVSRLTCWTEILSEKEDGNRWELKFRYGDRIVTLVRFEADFTDVWPAEVKDIKVVLGHGACVPSTFMRYHDETLHDMFRQRCSYPLQFLTSGVSTRHLKQAEIPYWFPAAEKTCEAIIPAPDQLCHSLYDIPAIEAAAARILVPNTSFKTRIQAYLYLVELRQIVHLRDLLADPTTVFRTNCLDAIERYEQYADFLYHEMEPYLKER